MIDPIQGTPTIRRHSEHAATRHKHRHHRNQLKVTQPLTKKMNSPPSLITSPSNSTSEINLSPSTTAPSSVPEVSQIVTSVQILHDTRELTRRRTADTPAQASPSNTRAQLAAASIVKGPKSSKNGSMREAAAYYLSSFLEHIDTLGKFPIPIPNPPSFM